MALADVPSMQITVTHDDGTAHDVTAGLLEVLEAAAGAESLYFTEAATVLADLRHIPSEHAEDLIHRVETEIREAEENQRRRDEFARTEAARKADRQKAAAHLAREMREKEPALVRAGWTDAELVELHRMRNAGIA